MKPKAREALLRRRQELEAQEQALLEQLKRLEEIDPYWSFVPYEGKTSEEGWKILRDFLPADEVPVKLWGQTDVFASAADTLIVLGGNQAGKSLVAVMLALMKVTGECPRALEGRVHPRRLRRAEGRPTRVRVVGQDYVNGILKNLLPAFMYWVPREYLKNGSWRESYNHERRTLALWRGEELLGEVEFMSNEQDVSSFQGPPRDLVIYDEQPREDIRKENRMRETTALACEEAFTMTPTEGITWTYDKLYLASQDAQQSIECFELSTVCNPKANLEVVRANMGEFQRNGEVDQIRMRLLGKFTSLTGLVYGGLYDPGVHDVAPFEYRCTCHRVGNHAESCPWRHYFVLFGMDPHTVKPTAIVKLVLDRDDRIFVVDCYQREADTEKVKTDFHEWMRGCRRGYGVVDPHCDYDHAAFGGRNIYKELTRGLNAITPLRKGHRNPGSVNTAIDVIKRRLSNKTLFFFKTQETLALRKQVRTLQREAYVSSERGVKDKVQEGKSDLHAAMRYPFQYPLHWQPVDGGSAYRELPAEAAFI